MRSKRRVVIWLTRRGKIKLMLGVAIVALLAGAFSLKLSAVIQSSSVHYASIAGLPLSGKIIAIDPGHGGKDGGAVSRDGVVEKHVNLAVSLYLRDYLQQGGALVVMTREEDKDLADPAAKRRKTQDLHRRAELVNKSEADMLISVHMNSVPSSRWYGAQTFYNPRTAPESKTLATFIQEAIKTNMQNTTREVNTITETYLLKTATMPAALVEVGFLSHPAEAKLLSSDAYQKKMAEAIYLGILRFASGETLNPTSDSDATSDPTSDSTRSDPTSDSLGSL